MSNHNIEGKRLQFQAALEDILGSRKVYFQPLPNFKLSYPCIVYHRVSGMASNADNLVYQFKTQYEVTYISTEPTNFIFEALTDRFHYCTFNRTYVADRLYHNVYTIYI